VLAPQLAQRNAGHFGPGNLQFAICYLSFVDEPKTESALLIPISG
jgi:hypothetical protein